MKIFKVTLFIALGLLGTAAVFNILSAVGLLRISGLVVSGVLMVILLVMARASSFARTMSTYITSGKLYDDSFDEFYDNPLVMAKYSAGMTAAIVIWLVTLIAAIVRLIPA